MSFNGALVPVKHCWPKKKNSLRLLEATFSLSVFPLLTKKEASGLFGSEPTDLYLCKCFKLYSTGFLPLTVVP